MLVWKKSWIRLCNSIELRGIVESLANNSVSTLRANKKSWIRLCFEFCNEVNGIAACLIRFVMLMHIREQVSRDSG